MSVLVITAFGTRLAVTHDPKHSSAETRDHRKIRKVFGELNLESDLLRCIPLQRRCMTTVLLRNRSTESISLTATRMPRISRSFVRDELCRILRPSRKFSSYKRCAMGPYRWLHHAIGTSFAVTGFFKICVAAKA